MSGVSTLTHHLPHPSPPYLDSSDQRRVRGFHIPARERPAFPSMPLRTKEQALRSWYENDQVTFLDLLGALEQCKDITTEYGLNLTAHERWRLGDSHKKTAEPDRHDYPIAVEQGIEVSPGPDWHKLFRSLISQRALFLPYHTVYLVTDNRDLQSDEVQTTPGVVYWPKVAAWWQERIRYVGPYGEFTTVVCRTTLEVIIPSRDGLSPEQWKDTATLCPLDWPSNYSLLRLWHMHGSLQKTENDLRSQTGHNHMFASWTVHHHLFAERVLFRRPPMFEAATVLQDHIRNGIFPNRRLRQRPQAPAFEAHRAALAQLRQREAHQRTTPVTFELTNEWKETITADKRHHRNYQLQGLTGSDP